MRTTLDADTHEAFDQQLGAAGEYEAAGEDEADDDEVEEVAEATPATGGEGCSGRPRRPASQPQRRRSSSEGAQEQPRRLSGGNARNKRAKKAQSA